MSDLQSHATVACFHCVFPSLSSRPLVLNWRCARRHRHRWRLVSSCCRVKRVAAFTQCAVYKCAPPPVWSRQRRTRAWRLMKWALGRLSPIVVIQDQMLSTAQQMLQDSRSKIELIRLQIIKVTQAGSGGGEGGEGGSIGGDGHQDGFTHRGQSPRLDLPEGRCRSKHSHVSPTLLLCVNQIRAPD